MPGWIISVYRQQNYGLEPANSGAEQGVCVATWHTGLGGTDWIDLLVKRKNAISLSGECLMFEYTAKAKYLRSELLSGPPHINMMSGYTKNTEALEACDKNEWLLIQVWDDS